MHQRGNKEFEKRDEKLKGNFKQNDKRWPRNFGGGTDSVSSWYELNNNLHNQFEIIF